MTNLRTGMRIERQGIEWVGQPPERISGKTVSNPYPDPRGTGRLMINIMDDDGSYQPAVPITEVTVLRQT